MRTNQTTETMRRRRRCRFTLIVLAAVTTTTSGTAAAGGASADALRRAEPRIANIEGMEHATADAARRMQGRNGGRHNKKNVFGSSEGDDEVIVGKQEGNLDDANRHFRLPSEGDAINLDVEYVAPPTDALTTATPTTAPTSSPTSSPTVAESVDPCAVTNGILGTSDTAERFTVDYVYEAETRRQATIQSMPQVVETIEGLVSGMLADLVDPECAVPGGSAGSDGSVREKIVGINFDPLDEVLPLRSKAGKCTTEPEGKNKCFVVTGGITFHVTTELSESEREALEDRIIATFGGNNLSGFDNSANANLMADTSADVVRVTIISPSRGPEPTVSPKPSTAPPTLSPKPTISPPPEPTVSPHPTTVTREPTATMAPTLEPTASPTAAPTASPTDVVTEEQTASFCDGTVDGFAGTVSDDRVRVKYEYEIETRPVVTSDVLEDVVLPLLEVAVNDMLLSKVFAECSGDGSETGGSVGTGSNDTAIDEAVSLRSNFGGRSLRAAAPAVERGGRARRGLLQDNNLGRIVGISARPNDKVLSGESCRGITAQGDNTCTVVEGDLSLYLAGPELLQVDESRVVLERIQEALDGSEFDNLDPARIVRIRYRPTIEQQQPSAGILSDTTETVVTAAWFLPVMIISVLVCCCGVLLVAYGWRQRSKASSGEWGQRDDDEHDSEAEQLHEVEQGGGGYDNRQYDDGDEAEAEQLDEAEQGYNDGYRDAHVADVDDEAEADQLDEIEQLEQPTQGYYGGGYHDGEEDYDDGYNNGFS